MRPSRRAVLASLPVVAGAAAWIGLGHRAGAHADWPSDAVTPDDPGTFSVAETERLVPDGDEASGAIDYAVAVDSAGVENVDADPDVFDVDHRHGATTVWGTVHGGVHTYSVPEEASVTYLETRGHYPPGVLESRAPQFVFSRADAPGETEIGWRHRKWRLEVTGGDTSLAEDSAYAIEVTDTISDYGRTEWTDGTDDGWMGWTDESDDGTDGRFVGHLDGAEDYFEMSGQLQHVALRPLDSEVRLDRYRLDCHSGWQC